MNGEAPLVFEFRPSFSWNFEKEAPPLVLAVHSILDPPPQKIRKNGRTARRGGGRRAVLRAWRDSGQSERTWRVKATTRAERAKSVRVLLEMRPNFLIQ